MATRKLAKRRRRRPLGVGEEAGMNGDMDGSLDVFGFDDATPPGYVPRKNVEVLGPEEALKISHIRVAEGLEQCSRLCDPGKWVITLSGPASGGRIQVDMIAADPRFVERFYEGCLTKQEFFGRCLIIPDFMTGGRIAEGAYQRALLDDDADTDFVVRTDHKVIKHTVVHRWRTTHRWRRANGDICALLEGSSFTPNPFFPVNQVVEQHRALAPFLRSSAIGHARFPPPGREHYLESGYMDPMEGAWHQTDVPQHAHHFRRVSPFDDGRDRTDFSTQGSSSVPPHYERTSHNTFNSESIYLDDDLDDEPLDRPKRQRTIGVVTPRPEDRTILQPEMKGGNAKSVKLTACRNEPRHDDLSPPEKKDELPQIPSLDDELTDDLLSLEDFFPNFLEADHTSGI